MPGGAFLLTRLSAVEFLVGLLAVWRVTHLLWGEDGPGAILVRLRKLAGNTLAGSLLDCFYCLSLWIALPVAWIFGTRWLDRVLLWLSFSGGAILLERITAQRSIPPAAEWHESSPEPADSK